jgi:hypothetical protein
MKGTIYGNRLPRDTQVKKGWEPLVWMIQGSVPGMGEDCYLPVAVGPNRSPVQWAL